MNLELRFKFNQKIVRTKFWWLWCFKVWSSGCRQHGRFN